MYLYTKILQEGELSLTTWLPRNHFSPPNQEGGPPPWALFQAVLHFGSAFLKMCWVSLWCLELTRAIRAIQVGHPKSRLGSLCLSFCFFPLTPYSILGVNQMPWEDTEIRVMGPQRWNSKWIVPIGTVFFPEIMQDWVVRRCWRVDYVLITHGSEIPIFHC